MADQKGKTALVLAGGGMPGWIYEIGCLTALDDFCEGFSTNDFDIFVGTSAGSSVAAIMANQVKPREIYDAISQDQKSYYNFRREDIYSISWKDLFASLKKLVKCTVPMLTHYYRNRKRFSFLDLIHMLEENLPAGFFSLDNYDRSLTTVFSQGGLTNDFRKLRRELYIPAVDVDRGRYDVFGEGDLADVPISKAIVASSSIPLYFPPVSIKGRDYMDAGAGRVTYIDIAMNHGATLILVINPIQHVVNDKSKVCIPTISGHCASLTEKGFTYIFDQALRLSTETRVYMGLKRYLAEHPDKDFLYIHPQPDDSIMFLSNILTLQAQSSLLSYGYTSTVKHLKENFLTYQKVFEKHGITVTLDRFKT